MDCITARGLVWPPERPRLAGTQVVRARAHVAECSACRAYFEQDRALLDAYDRARAAPAPIGVRERVFETIARARWEESGETGERAAGLHEAEVTGVPLRRRVSGAVTALWSLAVAATVGAVGGILLLDHAPLAAGPEDANVFVEDYLRRAVGEDHIETSDPAEVRRFLERELGLSFDPIHFAGLALARAEICLLEGRRGAMIVYESDDGEVSHYLIPRSDASARAPALSRRPEGAGHSMPVVTWATRDLEQALVGGVGPARLLAIASAGSAPVPSTPEASGSY